MKDKLAVLVSILCGLSLAFGAGVIATLDDLGPNQPVEEAYNETKNLMHNWRNDLGIEPERVLVGAGQSGRPRVSIISPDRMEAGNRLVSGVSVDKESRFGVYLFNERGEEIHFWPIRYNELTTGTITERNVFQHGIAPMRDGSIVVNFDNGDAIARIGPCGDVLWATPGRFHHSVHIAYDGTLWSWQSPPPPNKDEANTVLTEYLVQMNPEDGTVLRRIDLIHDVIEPHKLHGRFAIHSAPQSEGVSYQPDPFHPNDIEVLSADMAAAFPMFSAGDLMISLRSLNMIAVLDSTDLNVKWSSIGPWHRQHDPDFQPNGTITLLNNNMGLGASQVVAVDPATNAVSTLFENDMPGEFYTWQRGSHEVLGNGNVVVAETERGRAFEADRTGAVVWRFENVFDENRNGLINFSTVLPTDYFDANILRACQAGETVSKTPDPHLSGS